MGPDIQDLGAVQAPVLFLWGSESTWRSIEDGRLQAEGKPESRFQVIESAGHLPMDTHTEQFAGLISHWAPEVAVRAE